MTIDQKVLKKWEALRSPEDTAKLVELMPDSYPEKFARVFRFGKCSDSVFEVMAKFYTEKEIKMQQLFKS